MNMREAEVQKLVLVQMRAWVVLKDAYQRQYLGMFDLWPYRRGRWTRARQEEMTPRRDRFRPVT